MKIKINNLNIKRISPIPVILLILLEFLFIPHVFAITDSYHDKSIDKANKMFLKEIKRFKEVIV